MSGFNIEKQLQYFTDPTVAELRAQWLKRLERVEVVPAPRPPSMEEAKRYGNKETNEGDWLTYSVDGQRLGLDAIGKAVQAIASYRGLNEGLRIINVSEAEAELYRNTDLHAVDPQEWHQSFPLLIVLMPHHIYPQLLGVVSLPQVGYHVNLFSFLKDQFGKPAFDHCFIGNNFERAFRQHIGRPAGIRPEAGRVAVNAVLHLANYPELYGRYSAANQRVIVRTPDAFGAPKRRELIPQIIRLNQPVDAARGEHDVEYGPTVAKRPHHRRGHWRQVPCGVGRDRRRLTWIRPVLVNAKWITAGEDTRGLVVLRD